MAENAFFKLTAVLRRIFGGILSLFVGWCAFLLLIAGIGIARAGLNYTFDHSLLRIAMRGALAAGLIAVLANLVFLAFYLFPPRHSPLWRWPIATLCGAVGGAAIGFLLPFYRGEPPSLLVSAGVAAFTAFTGAATCLFAALSAPRLLSRRQAPA